jgi:putative MATE family efflux protein
MDTAHDLTHGNLSLHLIRLAAPLILGNILQQLYNTVDAWVIGRYADEWAFAAIGVSGSVMNLFLFAIVGACTGISVIFAQLYGKGDLDGFRREHFLSLLFGLLATAAVSGAGVLCMPAILRLIQVPDTLTGAVGGYLSVVLLGLPAAFLYNLYSALLRAVGRTYAVLAVLAAAVGVNLCLDLYFVSDLGLGIRGAAWATVIAQILSALLCLCYLRWAAPALLIRRRDCRMDRALLRKTARYSFVTALHQTGLYIGKLLVQGAVNSAGLSVISAYTATTRIEGFANSFGDSGSAATSVIVAQNLGAGDRQRVRKCFDSSLFLLIGLGLGCSVVMYLTAGMTVSLLLGSSGGAAYENACLYLRTVAVFYTLCFTGNTFAGYFDGIGKVSIPFIGAVSHITLRVILSWLLIPHLGLRAVAVATGIGWVWVNLFWTVLYRRQRGE